DGREGTLDRSGLSVLQPHARVSCVSPFDAGRRRYGSGQRTGKPWRREGRRLAQAPRRWPIVCIGNRRSHEPAAEAEMRIAVLGTGVVGKTIGTKLVELGHEVRMGSRTADNERAVAWAKDMGPTRRTARTETPRRSARRCSTARRGAPP